MLSEDDQAYVLGVMQGIRDRFPETTATTLRLWATAFWAVSDERATPEEQEKHND